MDDGVHLFLLLDLNAEARLREGGVLVRTAARRRDPRDLVWVVPLHQATLSDVLNKVRNMRR